MVADHTIVNFDEAAHCILTDTDYVTQTARDDTVHLTSDGNVTFLADGGSTCFVIQHPEVCDNIRKADIRIKVGSDNGKPSIVYCNKIIDDFSFQTQMNSKIFQHKVTVRIVPHFGCGRRIVRKLRGCESGPAI